MKMMKQWQGKKMIQVEEGREQKQWGQDGGCFVARSRPSGKTVCLVRRAPVESLSQKAARLLYQGAAPAQLRTASSRESRGLQSLIGHRFFALYRLLPLVWVWVLHFLQNLEAYFSLIGHQLGTVQGLPTAAVLGHRSLRGLPTAAVLGHCNLQASSTAAVLGHRKLQGLHIKAVNRLSLSLSSSSVQEAISMAQLMS